MVLYTYLEWFGRGSEEWSVYLTYRVTDTGGSQLYLTNDIYLWPAKS